MKNPRRLRSLARRSAGVLALGTLLVFGSAHVTAATISLADQPLFTGANIPGNLALVLSVEFPTGVSVANLGDYSDSKTYLGYFDPLKCYDYAHDSTYGYYFQPAALASGSNSHSCSRRWSGNFMNWATMQTIDPFRWALSGGYRSVDDSTTTILEKAWGPASTSQGNLTNYPDRGTGDPNNSNVGITTDNHLPSTVAVSSVTPFNWSTFNSRILHNGNRMMFSSTGTNYQSTSSGTDLTASILSNGPSATTAYQVYVRVKVCDTSALGTSGLESNCIKYGSTYKPEGLLQQYSNQIRYSAFGYLNGDGATRQGGVLREPMGFIGPTSPASQAGGTPSANSRAEWSTTTGIMSANPDTTLATASAVSQSGVMNYLNKFGEFAQKYETDDNVSELYYAALRYYEHLPNVPEWYKTPAPTSAELDGFPAVGTWDDPILYSCQKNFILGIGDNHTHVDYNVGTGPNPPTGMVATGTRTKPSVVASDTLNQAALWTKNIELLENHPSPVTPWWTDCCAGSTFYLAGLAYGAHVLDIRPDLSGTQTISTYWMDVMEYEHAENLNPYYLGAKYGGFTVPASGYDINNTTPLPVSEWNVNGGSIPMRQPDNTYVTQKRPDNYFLAGNAADMVSGLKAAFSSIASSVKAFTVALSTTDPNIASSGSTSFSSLYDSGSWTSTVVASNTTVATGGKLTSTPIWSTDTTLQTQLAGSGWDTGRRVVTWDGTKGVPFRSGKLTGDQQSAVTPSSYSSATTADQYVNYLRGDQTNEIGSSASGGTRTLRTRSLLLGDIVDAKLWPVGAPKQLFAESFNPGYAAFKSKWQTRPTIVYAAANDGMLHAFVGSNGTEQFAYVPSALFQGPTGTPTVNGLAALGNPKFVHNYYVDSTPMVFDIDLGYTGTGTRGKANWRSLLIGGLGKGGKSYYAIDVTDPGSMSTEAAVASAVKWEFTDATMGYSYGRPIVVKTLKYGWVVALTSGYNNSDGYGYLYLVNPSDGTLLEKIATPSAANGLAYATAYIRDFSDYTADAIYAGDLGGNVWRFDLTAPATPAGTAYPSATLIATLTDASGNAQPVTTTPIIGIYPTTLRRYILIGTGQLLSAADISSTAMQTFYAIIDGTSTGFTSALAYTGSSGSPITRRSLMQMSDPTVPLNATSAAYGWYLDLSTSTSPGWRVVNDFSAYNGKVAFFSMVPQGDVCTQGNQTNDYLIDYGIGASALVDANGRTVAYIRSNTGTVGMSFVRGADGNTYLESQHRDGHTDPDGGPLNTVIKTQLLNWRETPALD